MKSLTKTNLLALLLLTLFLAVPARAQKFDIGLQSSIVFQTLDQSNDDGSVPEIAPGFQNAVGNVTLRAEVFDGGLVATDFFLSSKHHNEMFGYQGYFQMTKLPEWMKLGAFNEFYAEHLEVKAGQFTIGFGDGHLYQSVNGDVTRNELVGNSVVRAAATSLGAEGTFKMGPASLLAGFSNGTTSGTTAVGKGIAVHAKATVDVGTFRASLSGYRVDHSANGTGYPNGGTKSYLFQGGDRAGSRYDLFGSTDGGEIFLGKGQDETAIQLDVRGQYGPVLLYGTAGIVNDKDVNGTMSGEDGLFGTPDDIDNGNPEDLWRFGSLTGRVDITPWLYAAARYSFADAQKISSVKSDGFVGRIQVGGGFRLYEGIVVKAEYVKQTVSGFEVGYKNGGADLGLNPKFSGFVLETAVNF